ncbi:hypothetical protein [Halomicronema sp. CCY15110]|uniref:hypothetical protein n=1 Tax=Halomicronema sp. CCY15110 TaxID=2767773 RepID=UPI001951F63E|nr:hypothetical protein [Halomicronema sp. CCY15110]
MQPEHVYARLEQLQPEPRLDGSSHQDLGAPKATSAPRWQRWGQSLWRYFVGSTAPRIQRRHDRAGRLYYRVYDPVDQRHYTFDSEPEVRVWLEGRYYQ